MGFLPIYASSDIAGLLAGQPNPSLVFDRYPQLWERKRDGTVGPMSKKDSLVQIVNMVKRDSSIGRLLEEINARRKSLTAAMGGRSFTLQTIWRYTSGLGVPHPSETGFRWDSIHSVPVIPGSSIKGAFRSWLRDYAGKGDYADGVLGKEGSGSVAILDALPEKKPVLEVDILNPHYKEYYDDPKHREPGDYYSPNPVFFLTVAPRTRFLFHLIPRPRATVDLEEMETLMREAFEEGGLGAKTASGYGGFAPVGQP